MPAAWSAAPFSLLRTSAETSCPAFFKRVATTLPMYPVPPVTNTFIEASPPSGLGALSTPRERFRQEDPGATALRPGGRLHSRLRTATAAARQTGGVG